MKKHIVLILLLIVPTTLLGGDCGCTHSDHYSRSFMYTRPANQHVAATWALWHALMDDSKYAAPAGFEILGLYQTSYDMTKTSKYFLFDNKDTLTVAGDDSSPTQNRCPTRDIRAEWLGFRSPGKDTSNFHGSFTVNPRQRQFMLNIHGRHDLGELSDSAFLDGLWFDIYIPILFVENNLRLQQLSAYPASNAEGAFATNTPTNLYEAFNQEDWHFGRLANCCQSRTALADLKFSFERIFWASDYVLIMYYSSVTIPTSPSQNPTYLFSPIVGGNGHFGFGPGVNFQVPLNRDYTHYCFSLYAEIESIFYARNEQMRTFDLKGRPWSRFLNFVHKNGLSDNTETIPGVDVLTRKVIVRPYNTVDFAGGFRITTDEWEFEIGYGIWGHGRERIELYCPFPEDYGIAGPIPGPNDPPPAPGVCASTASKSTIAKQTYFDIRTRRVEPQFIPTDETPPETCETACQRIFIPITGSDLDFHSCAAQSAFNNCFQASFGMIRMGERFNTVCGAGISVDYPKTNAALGIIAVWAKYGVTF